VELQEPQKQTGDGYIYLGIATKLQRIDTWIENYDGNAICYSPKGRAMYRGTKMIRKNIIQANSGDEIHFKCQPKLKKFTVSIKDEVHDVDIQDDEHYFPFIQGNGSGASAILFQPQDD